jgi:hypothetical protein
MHLNKFSIKFSLKKTYFNDNILSFKLFKRYAIHVCVTSESTYELIDNE